MSYRTNLIQPKLAQAAFGFRVIYSGFLSWMCGSFSSQETQKQPIQLPDRVCHECEMWHFHTCWVLHKLKRQLTLEGRKHLKNKPFTFNNCEREKCWASARIAQELPVFFSSYRNTTALYFYCLNRTTEAVNSCPSKLCHFSHYMHSWAMFSEVLSTWGLQDSGCKMLTSPKKRVANGRQFSFSAALVSLSSVSGHICSARRNFCSVCYIVSERVSWFVASRKTYSNKTALTLASPGYSEY